MKLVKGVIITDEDENVVMSKDTFYEMDNNFNITLKENKQLKKENERLKDIVSVPNIEIDKDLLITKANLIHWLDRTPTDDDKDLCDYLATAVKNQYQYKIQINNLNNILTELEEWLKVQGNNGIDEWGNHYTICLYKLNELKEKYK